VQNRDTTIHRKLWGNGLSAVTEMLQTPLTVAVPGLTSARPLGPFDGRLYIFLGS
jgi:hypothetical protein